MATTYVTVAIPFVNADPHLGYAYELVEADAYARARRAAGDSVRFLGGTDDYSLKNVLAAEAAGVSTTEFVRVRAARFAALAEPLGISFDDYIHTSADPRHRPAVERLWRACAASDALYRRAYEGDYCVGCERFYEPDELVDGRCPEHPAPLERVAEENWFFRLSRYQDAIERLIESGGLAIEPEPFRTEVLSFVRSGLQDISVSRSVARARGWGIPAPDDESQVIYVWFDALANYISALGFGDPRSSDFERWWVGARRRVHVIGKGILRFHAVYWPAFLLAAGVPLPTRIQVHPYLTADGRKLSKSSGVAVDPIDVVESVGLDALRWWFAGEVAPVADTDYSPARVVARANADLANGIGNVVNRVASLVHRYRGGRVPAGVRVDSGLAECVVERLGEFDLRGAVEAIKAAVAALNRDIEADRPWELARRENEDADGLLDRLLVAYVGQARAIVAAIEPIVPDLAGEGSRLLGGCGSELPAPAPLFRRLE